MSSKADSKKKSGESSEIGKFVGDIGTIGRALYADKPLGRLASSTASSRSKSVAKPNLPQPKQKPKDNNNSMKDTAEKDKKSSIWSWKGLNALTHVKNRRFNCCFSLIVHSVVGLPDYFDGVCLAVSWKRRDGEQMTSPVRVSRGVAEFEERLTHSCSVYGSRSGSHHSAKYEAKHFLLYAMVYDSPELDLGKHRMDLTRILPLTLEELEEEKNSGNWTTSFRLSGKAKGAMMNVSFGYVVIGNDSNERSSYNTVPKMPLLQQIGSRKGQIRRNSNRTEELDIRRAGSLPSKLSTSNQPMEEIKDLHEILPASRSELCDSVNILYQKLDEDMPDPLVDNKLEAVPFIFSVDLLKPDVSAQSDLTGEVSENEFEISDFSVVEKGILELNNQQANPEESSLKITYSSVEGLETDGNVEVLPLDEDLLLHSAAVQFVSQSGEQSVNICDAKDKVDDSYSTESLMKDLEEALTCVSNLTNEDLDPQEDQNNAYQEYDSDDDSPDKDHYKTRSLSLENLTNLVADDFLDMLGIEQCSFGPSSESEPDSPRERLLRQFEKDALASGSLINFDFGDDPTHMDSDTLTGSVWEANSDDFHRRSMNVMHDHAMPSIDIDELTRKTRASTLEDLEIEALMRECGINGRAFQNSPPSNSSSFGSPIDVSLEDPLGLPDLAEGLGPILQTQSGGFLRSMNPSLFKSAKSGESSLIMQVSKPVVVPAEMGSGVMDVLQGLASVGIEKLSMQANKLMPLEDVTGKSIEQIAWEAAPILEGPEGQPSVHLEQKSVCGRVPSIPRSSKPDSTSSSSDIEYVSLDDLAPLAMDKIEALSIEGLRIQSGMSENDAPSNISAQSIGEFSALRGKSSLGVGGSIGLDGTGGLQLLDIKDNGEDVDGLMGLSLTLDEWMRLDSGDIDDDDLASERTSKILAAHHATSLDQFNGRSKGEKRRGKGRKYGLLGNNFTVALMVQLRDPLRDYEAVGTPMLALIQVERVFVPPKPKIYSTVSLMRKSEEDDETIIIEQPKEEEAVDEQTNKIPQYKITEVHVAGLTTEPSKKKLWGSSSNQQSGSRWLLANGMGKKNKHPLMKSKAVAKNSGDTLWSVSSRVLGQGAKRKELAALNPHIRNPNVILPN